MEEETGISLAEPTRHVATTNDVMVDDGKHYVTIFMLAEAPEDAEPPLDSSIIISHRQTRFRPIVTCMTYMIVRSRKKTAHTQSGSSASFSRTVSASCRRDGSVEHHAPQARRTTSTPPQV